MHVCELVMRFAAELKVRPSDVRFVQTSAGPCYEALFHRIKIDDRTLALPEPLLCLVLAHEVGHATQRRTMLLDLAWTALSTIAFVSIPCYAFASFPEDDLLGARAMGGASAMLWAVSRTLLRPRAQRRWGTTGTGDGLHRRPAVREDRALSALEAMSYRVHIELARIDAIRARMASLPERQGVSEFCPCRAYCEIRRNGNTAVRYG